MSITHRFRCVSFCACSSAGRRARRALNVVASTEDLAAIAQEVGGDKITVESIGQGLPGPALRRGEAQLHPEADHGRPPHRRRPRAGDRLAAAAHPAEPQREDPAGRRRLPRRVPDRQDPGDPHRQVTRAMGDVHPLGNPHYWLDPDNGRRIAKAAEPSSRP